MSGLKQARGPNQRRLNNNIKIIIIKNRDERKETALFEAVSDETFSG
jgi:hypothetical protein